MHTDTHRHTHRLGVVYVKMFNVAYKFEYKQKRRKRCHAKPRSNKGQVRRVAVDVVVSFYSHVPTT